MEKLLVFFNLTKKDIFIIPGNHDAGGCDGKGAFTYYIENEVDRNQDCYRDYFVKGNWWIAFQNIMRLLKISTGKQQIPFIEIQSRYALKHGGID